MAHTAKVLTIAVAAYNVAPYIAQCLDSFVDEKLLPALDIVVIDEKVKREESAYTSTPRLWHWLRR